MKVNETSTPEVRDTLKQYLIEANDTHEQIFRYMENKGYYHPNRSLHNTYPELI